VEDIENEVKDCLPPKTKKVPQASMPKNTSKPAKHAPPMYDKKHEVPKPVMSSSKPKPFEKKIKPAEYQKPSLNESKHSIEEDIPFKEEKFEAPKPEVKPIGGTTKPFGGMGSKSKPTFGKFNKPFGNPSNVNSSANDSKVNLTQEEPKAEPQKQEPVSFTEKYGIKNEPAKPSPIQPMAQNSGPSRVANNAPWMKNKPNVGGTANNNVTEEYIPTMSGAASSGPSKVGPRVEQNISAIPTMNQQNRNNSNIDSIPVLSDRANNQSNRVPRMGHNTNDQVDQIPTIGGSNNDQSDNIPTVGSNHNNSQIDNIPTIGQRNTDSRRRIAPADNNSGYVPSGIVDKKPEESNEGGRRRVADPFAKFDNSDPLKNINAGSKPLPFGNNNNISMISKNSNSNQADSMFQPSKNNDLFSNKVNKPTNEPNFMDKFKNQEKPKEKPKSNFWDDMINDKPTPAASKAPEPRAQAKPMEGRVDPFNNVASFDDELILD